MSESEPSQDQRPVPVEDVEPGFLADEGAGAEVPSQPRGGSTTSISVPATGHPQVDSILGRLEGLDALPVSEHVRVFEDVLTGLRSALAEAGEPADRSV